MGNEELTDYPEARFSDGDLDLEPQHILRRQLLGRLIVGQTIGVSLLALMTLVGGLLAPDSGVISVVPLGVIALIVGLVAYGFFRREQVLLAAYIFLLGTVLAITSLVYLRGYQDASALYYLWPLLAGALLLGTRGAITITVVCVVLYGAMVVLQVTGYQLPPVPYDPERESLLTVGSRLIMFFLLTVLGWFASRNLGSAVQRTNEALSRWRDLSGTLEERVAERTLDLERRARYLEATAAVARDAAAITDVDRLLAQIVQRISEQFGFYHVGIFLLDSNREWAVLRAASSEGGQRMLARDHRLRVGEVGIVGHVMQFGQPRVALDVGEDAAYFDNPDLPETRSELALPLRFRDVLIGALDVQSRERQAFREEDVAVLQTLADQLAVAIENSRLFRQAEASLASERRAYGELSREAWAELLRTVSELGFVRNRQGIRPVGDLWRPEMETAVQQGRTALGDDGATTLAIPIKIGDRIIGVVDARRRAGARDWAPEEIQLLETLSEQVGVALESARLFQDSQRAAARDRLMTEIAARVRESLDMHTVLETAANELYVRLGLERVAIHLSAEKQGMVEPVVEPGGDNGDSA